MLKGVDAVSAPQHPSGSSQQGESAHLDNIAIRCENNGPRALRLDSMARSRRQCSAPCPPRASTIDCAHSARSWRLRVTLALISLWR